MIDTLIEIGESKTVEFKEIYPQKNQIEKTVCAFANRAGGYILIGVKDDGEIVGVDRELAEEYLEKIPNFLHDNVFPMMIPEIYTYNIGNKIVVVIQIYPGNRTPYYIKSKGKAKGTYVRVGRTNKLADDELLNELERRRYNKTFEEDTFREMTNIDFDNLKLTLEDILDKEITYEKLNNLHLVEKVGNISYLTNAGGIILGELTNCNIKCARFSGDSVINFIDKKEFSGDIISQLLNTINFIKNHINTAGIIKGSGLKRVDVQEIPDEVLREAVVNAIIHRDYSISGSDIKVAVYNEKIEIISPGGLPKTITVEEIYAGRSEIRNKIISKIFLRSGLIEQWGSGIPRMREMCKGIGLVEPELSEDGMFVKLTIHRAKHNTLLIKEDKVEYLSKSSKMQSQKEEIMTLIDHKPELTVKEIGNKLNISLATVQRRLASLQSEGELLRVGSKKVGYWKVLKK